jgi:hypothetical protein
MENSKVFEIGELVEWITGNNVVSKGIVRDDFGEEVEVVVYEINNQPTRKKFNVQKSVLC